MAYPIDAQIPTQGNERLYRARPMIHEKYNQRSEDRLLINRRLDQLLSLMAHRCRFQFRGEVDDSSQRMRGKYDPFLREKCDVVSWCMFWKQYLLRTMVISGCLLLSSAVTSSTIDRKFCHFSVHARECSKKKEGTFIWCMHRHVRRFFRFQELKSNFHRACMMKVGRAQELRFDVLETPFISTTAKWYSIPRCCQFPNRNESETPCSVSHPSPLSIHAEHILQISLRTESYELLFTEKRQKKSVGPTALVLRHEIMVGPAAPCSDRARTRFHLSNRQTVIISLNCCSCHC